MNDFEKQVLRNNGDYLLEHLQPSTELKAQLKGAQIFQGAGAINIIYKDGTSEEEKISKLLDHLVKAKPGSFDKFLAILRQDSVSAAFIADHLEKELKKEKERPQPTSLTGNPVPPPSAVLKSVYTFVNTKDGVQEIPGAPGPSTSFASQDIEEVEHPAVSASRLEQVQGCEGKIEDVQTWIGKCFDRVDQQCKEIKNAVEEASKQCCVHIFGLRKTLKEDLESRMESLVEEVESFKEKIGEYNNNTGIVCANYHQCHDALGVGQKKVKKQIDETVDLQLKKKGLSDELDKITGQLTSTEKEKEEIEIKKTELQKQKATVEERLESEKRRIMELQTTLCENEADKKIALADKKRAEEKVQELEKEKQGLHKKLTETESERKKLQQAQLDWTQALEQEHDKLLGKCAGELKDMRNGLKKLETEFSPENLVLIMADVQRKQQSQPQAAPARHQEADVGKQHNAEGAENPGLQTEREDISLKKSLTQALNTRMKKSSLNMSNLTYKLYKAIDFLEHLTVLIRKLFSDLRKARHSPCPVSPNLEKLVVCINTYGAEFSIKSIWS